MIADTDGCRIAVRRDPCWPERVQIIRYEHHLCERCGQHRRETVNLELEVLVQAVPDLIAALQAACVDEVTP